MEVEVNAAKGWVTLCLAEHDGDLLVECDTVAHTLDSVFIGFDRLKHESLDHLEAVVRRLEDADNVAVVRLHRCVDLLPECFDDQV